MYFCRIVVANLLTPVFASFSKGDLLHKGIRFSYLEPVLTGTYEHFEVAKIIGPIWFI